VRDEIAFAFEREAMTSTVVDLLAKGDLPERITHNDTKLNNVLIDDETSEGICVIDLDTVMPGSALYDFGDMVRSATNSAREDEPDTARITMQLPVFEALVRGYLASAGEFLTRQERELLAFSGRLITFETGIRFLADHLVGDTYFKTHRPGQNLDRCRGQFKLLQSMEAQSEQMERLVDDG
jgi:Ser/Thr protein kinase RdoA (MazF antagonist)